MRAKKLILAIFTLAVALVVLPAASAHGAVRATQLGTFVSPVYVAAPPADPRRLMVVEKDGTVRMLRDGVRVEEPFLDIRSDVTARGEEGLLGLAFAPDYATSRKVYAYYTSGPSATGNDIVIDEFTAATEDRADASTRRRLITIPHQGAPNHNGGTIQFGPDGKLYTATGDGGGGNDVFNNAQTPGSRLGKLLRIDVASGAVETIAVGLRNPFRFSFDRATGDLILGDVGQGRAEELDYLPAGTSPGVNFGWACFEGFERTSYNCPSTSFAHTPPVLEQLSSAGWRSIIGGYVVRDPALTDLAGRYLYGDNSQSQLHSVALPTGATDAPVPGLSIELLAGFGEDGCGHIYAASLAGPVYRIDGEAPPSPCPEALASGDRVAPVAKLTRSRTQRALKQKGFVLSVRCDEACGFTASGKLSLSGDKRRFVLRPVSRLAAAGSRTKVRLRMSSTATKLLRRTLARRRGAAATLTVTARDAAGNQRVVKAGVRVKR